MQGNLCCTFKRFVQGFDIFGLVCFAELRLGLSRFVEIKVFTIFENYVIGTRLPKRSNKRLCEGFVSARFDFQLINCRSYDDYREKTKRSIKKDSQTFFRYADL
jgi:hypothetical protein